MKKQVFCGVFALALAVTGCGVQKKEAASDIVPENRQELTILHVDAGTEGFDSFISQAEKDLGIKIHIEKCPANADNRQAKIATLLTSGDDSVDLITVNDEMISEFKHKGFLLPLEDTVMTEETAANFLQEYLKEICMSDGHIFSVPFRMDIMAFWVNQELLDQAGLDRLSCLSDLEILQKKLQNTGKYAYGDAWEISYIYNSISEYVDFFGGDYTDWTDPKTREAAEYMKRMLDTGMISEENLIDQHDQLNEKFINGQYGCMFMYTGVLSTFQNAGVYGKDKIHMAPFPEFDEKVTNIATWQYVLNKNSDHKEAALKFLQYVSGYEASKNYGQLTKMCPARLDVIEDKNFDLDGIEMIRQYLKDYKLKARPLCADSIEAVSTMGTEFQKYVLGQKTEAEFFTGAQNCIDQYYTKASY